MILKILREVIGTDHSFDDFKGILERLKNKLPEFKQDLERLSDLIDKASVLEKELKSKGIDRSYNEIDVEAQIKTIVEVLTAFDKYLSKEDKDPEKIKLWTRKLSIMLDREIDRFDDIIDHYTEKSGKKKSTVSSFADIRKKFRDYLVEGKNLGKLYHFTSYLRMIEIVESGMVLDPSKSVASEGISLTRNKSFKSSSIPTNQVRITLDGSKLSNNFKIRAYADISNHYGRNAKFGDENEELIVTSKPVPIKNFILSIDVIKATFNSNSEDSTDLKYERYHDLKEFLESRNVNFNIVEKF